MPRRTRQQIRDLTSDVEDARPAPGSIEAQNQEARAAAGREGFGVQAAPGPAQINAAIAPSGGGGQVVNNQFLAGAFAGTGGTVGGPREDVNVQLARSLLVGGNITDSHKQRLQRIVTSKDADARKRAQELSDFQVKKLMEARVRASNPISQEELDFGLQQVHQRTMVALSPNQTNVRREFEESQNPQVAVVNASEALSQRFGLHADSIAPMLGINKDTKEMDPTLYQKAFSMLLEQEDKNFDREQGSPRRQSAVKTSLARMDKEIALMRKDPSLFNQETGAPTPAPRTSIGAFDKFVGNEFDPRPSANYKAKADAFNKLIFDRGELAVLQDEFVQRTAAPVAQPAPLPGGETAAPLGATPPPASGTVDFADAGPDQYTAANPYVIKKGIDDVAVVVAAARRLAQKRNAAVVIVDPETGTPLTVE